MARLTDPELLARYHQALSEWSFEGAIVLEGRAWEGLRTTLAGTTARFFKECLYRFVIEEGGEIDQIKEQRQPWRDEWEWHFDLRPIINGVTVYVETRLDPESFASDHEPVIRVVQIKLA